LVGHSEEAQNPSPQPGRSWNPVNALTVGMCLIILIVGSVSFYWRRPMSSGLRRPLQFATTIHEALTPTGIVAADLNGDGNLDIVIAESANDSILILFGDSNGSFSKS